MKQRIWSALLALAMLLTLCPVPAQAAEAEEDNNILIDTIETHEGIGSIEDVIPFADLPVSIGLDDNPTYTNSYYDQLDAASQLVYKEIYTNEEYGLVNGPVDGSKKGLLSIDLTAKDNEGNNLVPAEKRSFTTNVTLTKTGVENGVNMFSTAYSSDDIKVHIRNTIVPAIGALLYDHPELSWLVNTEYSYSYETEPSLSELLEIAGKKGNDMTVGESVTIENQKVTFTSISYGMSADGYADATTPLDETATTVNYGAADTKTRTEIEAAITKATTAIGDLDGKSDYEKVKAIYDWICNNMEYADKEDGKFKFGWRGYQTPYSALVEHVTVCAGYAKSFKLLCDEYGITCAIVTGTSHTENHAWNYVEIDGNWYAVDCTWADQSTSISYNYLLKGSTNFTDHTEGTLYDEFKFAYPTLSVTDYVETDAPASIEISYDATPDATAEDGTIPAFSVPSIDSLDGSATKTIKFTAKALDENGSEMIGATVDWAFGSNYEGITFTTQEDGTAVLEISNSALSDLDENNGPVVTVTALCSTTKATQQLLIYVPTRTATFLEILKDGSALTTDNIVADGTATYTAKVYDQYGQEMTGQTVAWAVSNAALASVTDGTVKVVSSATENATFDVTATSGSATAKVTVTVTAKPAHKLTVPANQTMIYGETKTVTASSSTGAVITYSSGDPETVSVDDTGKLTANKVSGTTPVTITVTAAEDADHSKTTKTFAVTVDPKPLTSSMVSLQPTTAFTYNGTAQKPNVIVIDADVLSNTNYTVTYPEDCTNAGTVTVTVTGTGNYTGEIKKTYTINPASCTYTPAVQNTVTIGEAYPTGGAVEATGVNSEKVSGTLAWYTDAGCTTAASGKFETVGTTTLYWKFTHTNTNYNSPVTGSVDFTVSALPTLNVKVSPDDITAAYGGEPAQLEVTVTNKGGEPVEGATVTYKSADENVVTVSDDGKVTIQKPGVTAITVTVKADGYADGTATVSVDVSKRDLSIKSVTLAEKTYDGTTAATVTGVAFDNLVEGTAAPTYTATAEFTDANAGTNKNYTVTVTLGSSDYYQITDEDRTVTLGDGEIKPAVRDNVDLTVTVSTASGAEAVENDLSDYLPTNCGGTAVFTQGAAAPAHATVNLGSDTGVLSLSYNGDGSSVPEDETFTVTVGGMTNYEDFDITVTVKYTSKKIVNIEADYPGAMAYTGAPVNVYATSPDYEGEFVYRYTGTSNAGAAYDSETAPINAGTYTMTASIPESDAEYAGTLNFPFTVAQANLTVTAKPVTLTVGDSLPATAEYTVEGLVEGDTLSPLPTVRYSVADTSTPVEDGKVYVEGPAFSDDGNYVISYQPGKLVIEAKEEPQPPVEPETIAVPTANPNGGTFTGTLLVTLSCATEGATIYYTTDGREPTLTAVCPVYDPATGITLTETTTIKAIAVKDGLVSGVMSVTFTRTSGSGTGTGTGTTTRPSTGGSSSGSGSSGSGSTSSSSVTVPVSGDQSSVEVTASVSGSTATVSKIDTKQIENVIGGDVRTGLVEIDFSVLDADIDTVKLPADALGEIAAAAQSPDNDVTGLTIKLTDGEITFDADALAAVCEQAGSQVTLTIAPAKEADLNARQKETVGDAPVFDLTLTSNGKAISDFGGGLATVSLPYTLEKGQDPAGIVVYYLDDSGNIHECETMYDVRTGTVIFTTTHLSLYFIGYVEPVAEAPAWQNPFLDVKADAWYFDAVRFASENALMNGYNGEQFGPDDHLSRAMLSQILYNKEGQPAIAGGSVFTDVESGAWYAGAVNWAAANAIVNGYGDGLFGPGDNVTREQLAVMLWRYAGSPEAESSPLVFSDAGAVSAYALDAVRWAVANGIINGRSDGTLDPSGFATRAEVAQMLKNYLDN